MKRRVLIQTLTVLVVAAVAVPLAQAASSYDGYKSSYPQLHQLTTGAAVDLKSSYPQLHELTLGAAGDYKSSYPQVHAVLSHQVPAPVARSVDGAFHWSDAAIGAGTGAGSIFLLAGGALLFNRRHTRRATRLAL